MLGGRDRRWRGRPASWSRRTPHVRHRRKYADVPLAAGREFVFQPCPGAVREASTVRQFQQILDDCDVASFSGHPQRGDFSRWIRDVVQDATLAAEVAELEEGVAAGTTPEPGTA